MKNARIRFFLLLLLTIIPLTISAAGRGFRLARDARPTHSIVIGGSALYYYGDAETQNFFWGKGIRGENIGGGGLISYRYTFFEQLRLRAAIQGNVIRADNSAYFGEFYPHGKAYRKFQSVCIVPQIGVEWYPGGKMFYIYGGLELAVSSINYEFQSDTQVYAKGSTMSFLPMVGIELGLDIRLKNHFTIIPFIGVHQGLIEKAGMNLDGWPSQTVKAANGNQVTFGTSSNNKLADGYIQIGVAFSIGWFKCYPCRLSYD